MIFVFFKFIFIYLFLAALGLCCCMRLSLVAASTGYSSLQYAGFSLRWLLLLWSMGSGHVGKTQHVLCLAGSRAQAQLLWHTGLVAPRHVGSSRTRAQSHIPCIDRWILNHCATREAHHMNMSFLV